MTREKSLDQEMGKKKHTIVYDYEFNYFGDGTFNGKLIGGAGINIAIRAYKDGQEVKFHEDEEPKPVNGAYYNDIVSVSFDRTKIFDIKRNLVADNLFRWMYEFDKIEFEVVGYELDYYDSLTEEEERDFPKELKEIPILAPMQVSKEDCEGFIREHLDDFDIADNVNAQCPSCTYIDI